MLIKSFRPMRWLTLILQLISVFFNYLVNFINIGGKSIETVTAEYDSLFTPAGYTFAIWGIIYLALIAYCIIQLKPSQANHLAYERLNKYVRFLAVASMAWQIAFRNDWIAVSAFIIVLMLVAAVILFSRAHYAVNKRNFSPWFTVPFSLYLGWLSVATVANISILLVYIGWNAGQMEPATWVVVMLAILMLITQSISINFKDYVFPLVTVWASMGLWVALKNKDVTTAQACLGAAVAGLIIAIIAFYKKNKLRNAKQITKSGFINA